MGGGGGGAVALEKSPGRLKEDHANAKRLAGGRKGEGDPDGAGGGEEQYRGYSDCAGTGKTAVEFCDALHERGVWAQDTATYSVRMVTHWNVGGRRGLSGRWTRWEGAG